MTMNSQPVFAAFYKRTSKGQERSKMSCSHNVIMTVLCHCMFAATFQSFHLSLKVEVLANSHKLKLDDSRWLKVVRIGYFYQVFCSYFKHPQTVKYNPFNHMLCFYWLTSRTDVNQIILAPTDASHMVCLS